MATLGLSTLTRVRSECVAITVDMLRLHIGAVTHGDVGQPEPTGYF